MRFMLETTAWADNMDCNHIYVFNDSMTEAIAYVPRGTEPLHKFKRPLKIDVRGRTFVELEDGKPAEPDPEVITVEGSKGEKYYLTNEGNGWICSCPGFRYRSQCKHSAEMLDKEPA